MELCDACATECERFPGDATMEACAARCRRSAKAIWKKMIAGRP